MGFGGKTSTGELFACGTFGTKASLGMHALGEGDGLW